MDDFIISYYDLLDNDEELDNAAINKIKQESYLYSMRDKMNELLNNNE